MVTILTVKLPTKQGRINGQASFQQSFSNRSQFAMAFRKSLFPARHAVSRRSFVTAAASFLLAGPTTSPGGQREQEASKPPAGERPLLVVATDLYRPHDDPDDHWDLATAYALAQQNLVELLAVLIDYPRPDSLKDPDIEAVAQLNYLTGLLVPVLVGSGRPFKEWRENPSDSRALWGVQALLELMRNAPRPVVISVAGTCRNIAMAAHLDGETFRKKCAGVYVNAGTSRPLAENAPLEWNVTLDLEAYQAMFALPCPVYWMPCFEDVRRFEVSEYATYYRFRQGEVLPELSAGLRNFFAHIFRRELSGQHASLGWLQALLAPEDPELVARMNTMDRNMWCTAGFLHAAGLSVDGEGQLHPLQEAAHPVFKFEKIRVIDCQTGHIRWGTDEAAADRYIFRVLDKERYGYAMTQALKRLLRTIP